MLNFMLNCFFASGKLNCVALSSSSCYRYLALPFSASLGMGSPQTYPWGSISSQLPFQFILLLITLHNFIITNVNVCCTMLRCE